MSLCSEDPCDFPFFNKLTLLERQNPSVDAGPEESYSLRPVPPSRGYRRDDLPSFDETKLTMRSTAWCRDRNQNPDTPYVRAGVWRGFTSSRGMI